MRASLLTLASLVAAVSAGHGHPRASILGENTVAVVAAARARARTALATAGAHAAAAVPGVRLSARVLSAHAPPSGLVEVAVEWAVAHAPAEDVITLSCGGGGGGGNGDAADIADFFSVNASTGARTLLLPHGTGCAFSLAYEVRGGALFGRGEASGWSTAAVTAVPPLGADTDAVGTRLALGDAPGDMLLTWGSLNGSALAYARVGTTRGGPYPLQFFAPPPHSYAAADMCHAPASEESPVGYVFPGYFHTVALNLSAGVRYFVVYGQAGGVEAPETTFRTPAAPGPDVPTKFAAFGDAATYFIYPGITTTVDDIAALAAALDDEGSVLDFVSNIGDCAYAEGSVLLWAFWTGLMWPVTSRQPFAVSLGNHETNVVSCNSTNPVARMAEWPGPTASNTYGDDSGGEAGVAAFARYRGPSNGLGVLWYSMDVGSVHFVLFSSEHDYTPGSAQEQWLRADMLGVNRALTPWLVVGMHRPMYNVRADSDFSIDQGMVRNLEALFLEAKVDLALSGHYHLYERTHSIRNYTVDATGAAPVYITVGTGGATFHNESMMPELAFLSAYDDDDWGFALVEAFNRSALRVTYRPNIDGGLVRDEAWILRPERL